MDGNDQCRSWNVLVTARDGNGMHLEVAIVLAADGGASSLPRTDCRCEGTHLRIGRSAAFEDSVEVLSKDRSARRPLRHTFIGPDNGVFAIEKNYTVGHAFKDAFVLDQRANAALLFDIVGKDKDARKRTLYDLRECLDRIVDFHHFVGLVKESDHLIVSQRRISDAQDFELTDQAPLLLA